MRRAVTASPRSLTNLTGLILSVGCVIHCMLMPLVLASLPAWGLSWLAGPQTHQVLALLGIAIGLWALLPGWRVHRRHAVLLLAGTGLLVMNYVAFFGDACCSADPSQASANGSLAYCTESCCTVSLAENGNPPQTATQLNSSNVGAFISVWNWLLHHPTAFGAALLAWAHCLNGVCGRACCRKQTAA